MYVFEHDKTNSLEPIENHLFDWMKGWQNSDYRHNRINLSTILKSAKTFNYSVDFSQLSEDGSKSVKHITQIKNEIFPHHTLTNQSLFQWDNDHHEHGEDSHHDNHSIRPLLSVADFDGNGKVNREDIKDIYSRLFSVSGDEKYHPLYDLDTNGKINVRDLFKAVSTMGATVPLIDQQIARATQGTMKYYGSNGQKNAIADGYLPLTQEVMGHGIHYYNPTLADEVGNSKELDIERPVGLNYDAEGNLLAVFYLRFPERQQATPENPLAELFVDPADDFPPSSFATLTADDWHHHHNAWITGIGNLNAESVYFEEDVPVPVIISRLQEIDFQVFPESDKGYSPKFWMLHGWFHSLNPEGTFANHHPDVGIYAPQELGVHGEHHDSSNPLIAGTDQGERLFGTVESDRINGFAGDDWIAGGGGNDSIWGSYGDDWLRGDDDNSSAGGDDMVYGGPGKDRIYGQAGNDRLFGGTEDDIIVGGVGDDLLRGGLGYDILTGNEGKNTFVLAPGEGIDIITDLELGLDNIVLYAGITTENTSIQAIGNNTALGFNNQTLAILSGINANDLIAASEDVFIVA